MTSPNGAGAARPTGESRRSLKDQNRWQLWLVVVANSLLLYGVVQANAIEVAGLRAAFKDTQNLIPMGLALVVATVLNGLISADMKARLVFLRLRQALPGHRAFSKYARRDPRIDLTALEKLHGSPLPVEPVEQNRAWYKIYKGMENDPAVRQVHRDFLLLRDYAGLCVVFIVFFGAVGLYTIPSMKVGVIYLVGLIVQYLLVRQAASNLGVRLITTVLARQSAKEPLSVAPARKKRIRSKTPVDPLKKQEE